MALFGDFVRALRHGSRAAKAEKILREYFHVLPGADFVPMCLGQGGFVDALAESMNEYELAIYYVGSRIDFPKGDAGRAHLARCYATTALMYKNGWARNPLVREGIDAKAKAYADNLNNGEVVKVESASSNCAQRGSTGNKAELESNLRVDEKSQGHKQSIVERSDRAVHGRAEFQVHSRVKHPSAQNAVESAVDQKLAERSEFDASGRADLMVDRQSEEVPWYETAEFLAEWDGKNWAFDREGGLIFDKREGKYYSAKEYQRFANGFLLPGDVWVRLSDVYMLE